MIADDLFAGAGGWDLAAAQLGIHARGVEIMPEARATRLAAGLKTIHDDAWTYAPDGSADGLIASPPCQTFSTAGLGDGTDALLAVLDAVLHSGKWQDMHHLRRLAAATDRRTALVLLPLHFATKNPYRWLAWEQVPPVLPIWEACAGVLQAEGWSTWTGVVSAEQYGVPQCRRRAILIASRDREVGRPVPTHSAYHPQAPAELDPAVKGWVSMAEAVGWGMTNRPAFNVLGGGERASFAGAEWGGAPTRLALLEFAEAGDPLAWVPRPRWRRHADRNDAIRVSPAEAGVLQTFPRDYPWQGTNSMRYLQAGNAVPPALAHAVLREAAGVVTGAEYDASLAYGRESDLLDLVADGAGVSTHAQHG